MHYCPATEADPVDCPAGYYTTSTVATVEEDCVICPAGWICNEDDGAYLATFTPCPGGNYCPAGTYTTVVGGTGGPEECGTGSYCPVKTPARIPCPPGYACTTPTLDAIPTGTPCTAGYYCDKGDNVKT